MKRAFYWGCYGPSGHYLHDDRLISIYDDVPGLPWDDGLMDTGLLKNGKRPDVVDGKVFWTRGGRPDLWFAFYWWDRSGDKRSNSNSGFYVSGFDIHQQADAFKFACDTFPSIVARQAHPLILQL